MNRTWSLPNLYTLFWCLQQVPQNMKKTNKQGHRLWFSVRLPVVLLSHLEQSQPLSLAFLTLAFWKSSVGCHADSISIQASFSCWWTSGCVLSGTALVLLPWLNVLLLLTKELLMLFLLSSPRSKFPYKPRPDSRSHKTEARSWHISAVHDTD